MWKNIQKYKYLKAKENTPNFYVYIIECEDGSYYTGFTSNLMQRITDHRMNNGSKYTQKKGFKRLVYFETHTDEKVAKEREKQIKEAGRPYKKMIVGQFNQNLLLLKEQVFIVFYFLEIDAEIIYKKHDLFFMFDYFDI